MEPNTNSLSAKTGIVQFVAPDGSETGPSFDVSFGIDAAQLGKILNNFLSNEEAIPYSFYIQVRLICFFYSSARLHLVLKTCFYGF